MRKLIRNIWRARAKDLKVKQSEFIKNAWNETQIQKVGIDKRIRNQAKGTHKKSIFRYRIEMFTGGNS